MKKLIVSLVVGLMISAFSLMANAQAAVRPESAALGAAIKLLMRQDYVGARAALKKVIVDYPNAGNRLLGTAQYYVGMTYYDGDKNQARVEFQKVLDNYSNGRGQIMCDTYMRIGYCARVQGKESEAQTAFMTGIEKYVFELGAKDEKSSVWKMFDQIRPNLLTSMVYKTFLENTLKATAATEENAKFLGRLKSELEKIR